MLKFLKTGKLNEVILGMSLSDFEAIVGQPQDISESKKPIIYKYGSFQFSFSRVKGPDYHLSSIHLYFMDELVIPDNLFLSDWVPEVYMDHNRLIEYLHQSGIIVQADQRHTINNLQVGYSTEGGVILIFTIEGNEKKLASIHKN